MLCPNCEHDNIPGVDLCELCGTDLAGLDIPEASGGAGGLLLTDTIRKLPLTTAITAGPEDTVADAIGRMRDNREGFVLVSEGGKIIGIFTERDVVTRVLNGDRAPSSTILREVMTPSPTSLEPDDPPAFAIHRMVAQDFRHLPILADGQAVGVLSIRGVLRYLSEQVLSG